MPKFDLKDAYIKIFDGFDETGAVNDTAGFAAGSSSITVDGFTVAVHNGDTFKIGSDTVTYTVTSHTETLAVTTKLGFSPVLGSKAVDNAIVQMQNHQLTIKVGEGTVSFVEKRGVEYQKDRGRLDTVRLADEEPMEVSFDFTWEFLSSESGATTPTIEEALKKTGAAVNWVTSSDDTCEPYAVDIHIEYTPLCTDQDMELIILPTFRYEQLSHDLKGGQVAVTGKCNVTEADLSRVSTFPTV